MPMPNTSATGGYLTNVTTPIEGVDLTRFLGSVIAGVTALPGNLVRPAWQPNPPTIPDITTSWAAYGITSRRSEATPYMEQAENDATLIRHEELDILCTFYGPECQAIAASLRDGMYLSQNRENLFLAGMGLVGFSDIVHAPELINERFFDRADMTMTIRREIKREYRILYFVAADGIIKANRAIETLTREWAT